MKASDIPDDVFLQAVRVAGDTWAERWGHPGRRGSATWGDVTGVLRIILGAVPERVVLAKARRLIRRGLLDGCYCGCRGDWVIVDDLTFVYVG